MRHWLLKSEPEVYSIDHLASEGRGSWEGVRNHRARNFIRDEMARGDLVLFYHSSVIPPGAAGVARVVRAAYPDPTALDPASEYHDPRATPERAIWYTVDVEFVEKFAHFVTLEEMRKTPALAEMLLLRPGQRLSVMPVTRPHFERVVKLGRGGGRGRS